MELALENPTHGLKHDFDKLPLNADKGKDTNNSCLSI